MINVVNNSNLKIPQLADKIDSKDMKSKAKFSDILKNALEEANELKQESDKLTSDYLTGRTDNLHEVMIAAQKAEISIMFVTEVRNRIMDAYQEFARMQV
jgi:flagellar hook-basal body complex protein FliE